MSGGRSGRRRRSEMPIPMVKVIDGYVNPDNSKRLVVQCENGHHVDRPYKTRLFAGRGSKSVPDPHPKRIRCRECADGIMPK